MNQNLYLDISWTGGGPFLCSFWFCIACCWWARIPFHPACNLIALVKKIILIKYCQVYIPKYYLTSMKSYWICLLKKHENSLKTKNKNKKSPIGETSFTNDQNNKRLLLFFPPVIKASQKCLETNILWQLRQFWKEKRYKMHF